jgi:hypothetical protein
MFAASVSRSAPSWAAATGPIVSFTAIVLKLRAQSNQWHSPDCHLQGMLQESDELRVNAVKAVSHAIRDSARYIQIAISFLFHPKMLS